MDLRTWIYLALGAGLLVGGAELMIRGAVRISLAAGLSPLIVGLTIVAFATSAPELAVSLKSALSGSGDVAFGNVVGSNIINILLILGIGAAIFPMAVSRQLVRLDVPIMIGVSVLTLLIALDGRISRLDGVILVAAFIPYSLLLMRESRRARAARRSQAVLDGEEEIVSRRPKGAGGIVLSVVFVVEGLVLLVFGSRFMVESAVSLARALGVSELIVGLTVVAVGTSLPEIAATVVAAIRGVRDMAVGNAIGSNIFNILMVLGISSAVAPNGISVHRAALAFDLPFMIAVAVACLPIFFTGYSIDRWEGLVFLAYYGAYTIYLILDATGHDALGLFNFVMIWFAVPITVLTIIASVLRVLRKRRAERETQFL
jgi:cation:H+ antiporter